jgi:hypothetical protein
MANATTLAKDWHEILSIQSLFIVAPPASKSRP